MSACRCFFFLFGRGGAFLSRARAFTGPGPSHETASSIIFFLSSSSDSEAIAHIRHFSFLRPSGYSAFYESYLLFLVVLDWGTTRRSRGEGFVFLPSALPLSLSSEPCLFVRDKNPPG
ncbi:hypothetical protein GGS23DRAFT_577593 [Durotheca rogersii]|uniref:uncharacterized protein n=1 Tax=Durotheca rogersii TaxID=419775 RepID=UPI00221EA718|nr:uncharacterized protein GGS23DRAFT_577593 [Durotheca rogersii]KAI5861216.1 hypothetical protein GGS23DRAFT_577593 [Durotheca rogersii]